MTYLSYIRYWIGRLTSAFATFCTTSPYVKHLIITKCLSGLDKKPRGPLEKPSPSNRYRLLSVNFVYSEFIIWNKGLFFYGFLVIYASEYRKNVKITLIYPWCHCTYGRRTSICNLRPIESTLESWMWSVESIGGNRGSFSSGFSRVGGVI